MESYLGIVLSWVRAGHVPLYSVLRTPDSTPATIQRGHLDLDLSLMALFRSLETFNCFCKK